MTRPEQRRQEMDVAEWLLRLEGIHIPSSVYSNKEPYPDILARTTIGEVAIEVTRYASDPPRLEKEATWERLQAELEYRADEKGYSDVFGILIFEDRLIPTGLRKELFINELFDFVQRIHTSLTSELREFAFHEIPGPLRVGIDSLLLARRTPADGAFFRSDLESRTVPELDPILSEIVTKKTAKFNSTEATEHWLVIHCGHTISATIGQIFTRIYGNGLPQAAEALLSSPFDRLYICGVSEVAVLDRTGYWRLIHTV